MAKKKNRWLKLLIILLVSGIVIVGALSVVKKLLAAKKLNNTTYKVREEIYENAIDIAGTVSAAQKQTLQALSDGTVVAVNVKQGDVVKKGDVIIQLDDTTQKYNLAKHDYDMQTTLITGAARQYQLMKTQRDALVQKVEERKVTATFDGIIADIDVSVGDSLEAKDSVGTIVDVSYLTADVEISETDVSKLAVGQTVEFTFSALSGKTVNGYVVSWPAIGEVTSRGATVVKAKVRIDEYPEGILPNFSFSGKIKISPDEKYLIVERYAVGRENGQAFVQLVPSGEKINVTVSPYTAEYVKIESGLKGGEVLKAQSSAETSGRRRGGMGMGGMGGAMRGGMGGGMAPRGR
ncbi:MAG: HlyD family efflux transporter periplasmic adaptor subunit [Treponema sp.]|nr:HlyD family efflux transporter periplasmic adaptor subunit [Treponema sp.]